MACAVTQLVERELIRLKFCAIVSTASKFFLPFLILGLTLSTACIQRHSQLEVYDTVPAFTMTTSSGAPFDGKQLRGKVWVADFIYTNCPGPCPLMTSKMHKLQMQVKNDSDVQLVSFSVDPHRDTPAVLNAYAKHFDGPTADWVFLTGNDATTHLLAHDVFRVGDLIGVMDHSTQFILVDKHDTIRGYYSSFDKDDMRKLVTDLQSLR